MISHLNTVTKISGKVFLITSYQIDNGANVYLKVFNFDPTEPIYIGEGLGFPLPSNCKINVIFGSDSKFDTEDTIPFIQFLIEYIAEET